MLKSLKYRIRMSGLLIAGWLLASPLGHAAMIDCSSSAQGDTVCNATKTVVGSDVSVFKFTVDRGAYSFSLLDYQWPSEPLAQVSAILTSATATIGSLTSDGSLAFFLAPGTYFVQVFAQASESSMVGLYGLSIESVPVVPLPATFLLLMSALLGMMLALRKRRPEAFTAVAEPLGA